MSASDDDIAMFMPAVPTKTGGGRKKVAQASADDIAMFMPAKESFDEIVARSPGQEAPAPGPRTYANTGPLDAILASLAEQKAAQPTLAQRAGETLGGIGATFKGGATAVGEGLAHPVDTITSGPRRRQFERGLDDMVTLGHGQRLAARIGNALGDSPDVAIGPETFGRGDVANTQGADQQAAPEFRQLGNIIGAAAPGATGALAKGGALAAARILPGMPANQALAAALGAGRGIAGYQLSAPVTAGLSAGAEGNRMGAALDAATDPVGNVIAGGMGAAIGGAPARVERRIVQEVPHGETTAKLSVAKKFRARIGEDGEALGDLMARDPQLEKKLATQAGPSPGNVIKTVEKRMDAISKTTDSIYDQIDKAPDTRFVSGPDVGRPIGGVDINAVDKRFVALREQALKAGRIEAVGPIDKARAALREAYGTEMENGGKAVIPGTIIPARSMRNFANGIGETAFSGDATATPNTRVRSQQDLFRAVTGVIEDAAAKAPGVNVAKLKLANKDMSILLPMRDALKERAAKADVGRTSLYSLLGSGAAGGGIGATAGAAIGGYAGGVPGAYVGAKVGAAAGAALAPAAGRAARTLDYNRMQAARQQGGSTAAAKLMQLSRGGASDDEIQAAAKAMGITSP